MPEDDQFSTYVINWALTKVNFPSNDLDGIGWNKIGCIKAFREVTGYGLLESKNFIDGHCEKLTHKLMTTLSYKGIHMNRK